MGGDSESAFKNTPIEIPFVPLGPFHENFLKIWASDGGIMILAKNCLDHVICPYKEISQISRQG